MQEEANRLPGSKQRIAMVKERAGKARTGRGDAKIAKICQHKARIHNERKHRKNGINKYQSSRRLIAKVSAIMQHALKW